MIQLQNRAREIRLFQSNPITIKRVRDNVKDNQKGVKNSKIQNFSNAMKDIVVIADKANKFTKPSFRSTLIVLLFTWPFHFYKMYEDFKVRSKFEKMKNEEKIQVEKDKKLLKFNREKFRLGKAQELRNAKEADRLLRKNVKERKRMEREALERQEAEKQATILASRREKIRKVKMWRKKMKSKFHFQTEKKLEMMEKRNSYNADIDFLYDSCLSNALDFEYLSKLDSMQKVIEEAKKNRVEKENKLKRQKEMVRSERQSQLDMKIRKDCWSEEELHFLAKAVAKYPGGLSQRWEIITKYVNRQCKCEKTKNQCMRKYKEGRGISKSRNSEPKLSKLNLSKNAIDHWSIEQQQQLENALKNTKGIEKKERWNSIALQVNDKTLDECKRRVKWIRKQLLKK
eukprot:g5969.t1